MDSLAAGLDGWTPVRVRGSLREPLVDWAILDEPPRDPFFEQTVHRAMQHPFNQVFTRTTPLAALDACGERLAAVEPAGFVFHMSRCGSTLIAQMLSGLDGAIVLSEPQPLDGVLRLAAAGAADADTHAGRLRAVIAALSGTGAAAGRVFVKLYAWHVLLLPVIARAFPNVPWIFVFREPRGVLRSQEGNPGAEIVPGTIDPRLAGIALDEVRAMTPQEYCTRTLAAFCEAALAHARLGRSAFIEYDTLPGAVADRIAPFFGVAPGAAELQRMDAVAALDAKGRGERFVSRAATPGDPETGALAARWLDVPYAALRARAAAGAPP